MEIRTREEAMALWDMPIDQLTELARETRDKYCGREFHLCTIVNGKSGRCSEDCKYCAQSAHYQGSCQEYPLLDTETLVQDCSSIAERHVPRYAVVTAGRRLSKEDIAKLCQTYRILDEKCDIDLCASLGLLDEDDMIALKEAGVTRYHNNLESSRRYFPNICSTHTYDEKIATIKAAQKAGLEVCSGGIIGLGEEREDRVDMAFTLKELGIRSVPLNVLNPIPGTPLENSERLSEEEILRTFCIFRLILPDATIRMAGGRGLMKDGGREIFRQAANAAITGDMLTTAGITIQKDQETVRELGMINSVKDRH